MNTCFEVRVDAAALLFELRVAGMTGMKKKRLAACTRMMRGKIVANELGKRAWLLAQRITILAAGAHQASGGKTGGWRSYVGIGWRRMRRR